MKRIALSIASLLLVSCTDELAKNDDPFELVDTGKADGSGLLSAGDEQRLVTAFDRAIAASEQTISKLEAEIVALEAQHVAKQQEADAIVARIAAREQELRADYNRNFALCAWFPNPSTCVLANFLANDSTLTSYRRQLAAARAKQAQIMQDIASYRAQRTVLREKLEPIRAGKLRVLDLLRNGTTIPRPPELAGSPQAATAFTKAEAMRTVEDALAAEIALLVEIRDAAAMVASRIDASLKTLRALEQSVDALVQAQRDRFMDLLLDLLSGDPEAAAEAWLEEVLAEKTRAILETLDWPLAELARYIVETRGASGDPEDLLERMLEGWGVELAEPIYRTNETPIAIPSRGKISSSITIDESRTIRRLEIFADIEHTDMGDLRITLEKAGMTHVLREFVDNSEGRLAETMMVPEWIGNDSAGVWTLVVDDAVTQDSGRLRRWFIYLH